MEGGLSGFASREHRGPKATLFLAASSAGHDPERAGSCQSSGERAACRAHRPRQQASARARCMPSLGLACGGLTGFSIAEPQSKDGEHGGAGGR